MQGQRTDLKWPLTELDLKNLNDMLHELWEFKTGNIDAKNFNSKTKEQLFTYPLNIDKEGNLDSNHAKYFRFFIPEDVKKMKSASISAIVSRYRMDSGLTDTKPTTAHGGTVTTSQINTESTGGLTTGQYTDFVNVYGKPLEWGSANPPDGPLGPYNNVFNKPYTTITETGTYVFSYNDVNDTVPQAAVICKPYIHSTLGQVYLLDLGAIDHEMLNNHEHGISHTHEGDVEVTIEGHGHGLTPGIKESTVAPEDVEIFVNNQKVGSTMSESNSAQININILPYLQVGQNEIKVTTSNFAHIEIYGTILLNTRVY